MNTVTDTDTDTEVDTAAQASPRFLSVDVSDGTVPASLATMTLLELPDVTVHIDEPVTVDAITADPSVDDLTSDDPAATSTERTTRARCADGNGTLTHLFFSDDEFDLARAKAICGKCGLAAACLAGALERAEVYGVWGGQLLIDGEIVAVKRGRGRPPKTPRPPLVVDEVPLPPHLVA